MVARRDQVVVGTTWSSEITRLQGKLRDVEMRQPLVVDDDDRVWLAAQIRMLTQRLEAMKIEAMAAGLRRDRPARRANPPAHERRAAASTPLNSLIGAH